MTATDAQIERTAAKGKPRAESQEPAAVEPAPAPVVATVPVKQKKPVKPKPKEAPVMKQQAPNPYLAHRSSRRSVPVPSTSTGPQPPPDKPKRRKKTFEEPEDDDDEAEDIDEPDDDSSDEHGGGGGADGGGSSEEPENGAEGAPEADDDPDTDSGRDHTPADDFQQLSLDAAPLPPELATGSATFASDGPPSFTQRLTSTNLSALADASVAISSIAPSSTLSPAPSTTDDDELMITDLSVPPAPPTPKDEESTLLLPPAPSFRAPTPAQPGPDDSDSDDDHPRARSDLKRPRVPSSELTELTDSSASSSSDSQSESESISSTSAPIGSLVVRLRIPPARVHPAKRLRHMHPTATENPSLSPPPSTYSSFASSPAQQLSKYTSTSDHFNPYSNSRRTKRTAQCTIEIVIPRRRYRHGLVGPNGESEEAAATDTPMVVEASA